MQFSMRHIICSIAFSAALSPQCTVAAPAPSPIEPTPPSYLKEDWARQRMGAIQVLLSDKAKLRGANVLFVGDSITQFWTSTGSRLWEQHFSQPTKRFRGINFGFAGDRTENLLSHLQEANRGGDGYLDDSIIDPDIIVLLIGVNQTWETGAPVIDSVIAGNIAVISRLRHLRPRASIIVQSLLPAGNAQRSHDIIDPINKELSRVTKALGPKVRWLNVNPLFATADGSPSPELFVDTVHLSEKGYETWAPELLKALEQVQIERTLQGNTSAPHP